MAPRAIVGRSHRRSALLGPSVALRVGVALLAVSCLGVVNAWPDAAGAGAPSVPVEIGEAMVEVAPSSGSTPDFDVPTAAAIKVAARTCAGFDVGTAFVADDGTLLTARHVVTGGFGVIGGTTAAVTGVDAGGGDAASLAVDTRAMASAPLATELPDVGEPVAAVGHPAGGRLVTAYGVVTGHASGAAFGQGGHTVLLLSAVVEQGFSGGPVFDESGTVVAMIVAVERNSGGAVALPVAELSTLAAGDGAPPSTC